MNSSIENRYPGRLNNGIVRGELSATYSEAEPDLADIFEGWSGVDDEGSERFGYNDRTVEMAVIISISGSGKRGKESGLLRVAVVAVVRRSTCSCVTLPLSFPSLHSCSLSRPSNLLKPGCSIRYDPFALFNSFAFHFDSLGGLLLSDSV